MGAKLKVICDAMNAVNIRIQTCLKKYREKVLWKKLAQKGESATPRKDLQCKHSDATHIMEALPVLKLISETAFLAMAFLWEVHLFSNSSPFFCLIALGNWAFCSAPTHYLEKGVSRPMIRLKLCTTRCPETSRSEQLPAGILVRWDHKWSHLRHIQRM